MLEIRKLNGKTQHPRWSVAASDASICTAVVLPFVHEEDEMTTEEQDGQWRVDRSIAPPILVPMLSLGRKVEATVQQHTQPAHTKYTFTFPTPPDPQAGGPLLRSICIDPTMFSADAMLAVSTDLADMKVAELKEELRHRGKPCSGPKPMLLRRLHAVIVATILAEREEGEEEYASDS